MFLSLLRKWANGFSLVTFIIFSVKFSYSSSETSIRIHQSCPQRDISQVPRSWLLRKGQEICLVLLKCIFFLLCFSEEQWAVMVKAGPQPPLHHGRHLNPFPLLALLCHVYSRTGFQYWSVTAPFPFIHHHLLPAIFLFPPHPFLFYLQCHRAPLSHTSSCEASSSPPVADQSIDLCLVFTPTSFTPLFPTPYSLPRPPSLLRFHYLLKGWVRPDAGNLALWLHRTCMNDTQPCSQYPFTLSHDFNHY